MSEVVNRLESEMDARQGNVPMWIWGVATFVAAYAVMLQQQFA